MLVLSSTVASRYYNCCTDGSTSPGNYGYLRIDEPQFAPKTTQCTFHCGNVIIQNGMIRDLQLPGNKDVGKMGKRATYLVILVVPHFRRKKLRKN
jgi:hypothetical protein